MNREDKKTSVIRLKANITSDQKKTLGDLVKQSGKPLHELFSRWVELMTDEDVEYPKHIQIYLSLIDELDNLKRQVKKEQTYRKDLEVKIFEIAEYCSTFATKDKLVTDELISKIANATVAEIERALSGQRQMSDE